MSSLPKRGEASEHLPNDLCGWEETGALSSEAVSFSSAEVGKELPEGRRDLGEDIQHMDGAIVKQRREQEMTAQSARMSFEGEVSRLRLEAKGLRQAVGRLRSILEACRRRGEGLAQAVAERDERIRLLVREKEVLTKEVEQHKRAKESYQRLIFRPRVAQPETAEQAKRSRGGQPGHRGVGREKPEKVDEVKRVYGAACPVCGEEVERSKRVMSHTVEDIPPAEIVRPRVVRYDVERQWCRKCQREVVVRPEGVIAGSRLGINFIVEILRWRYLCRLPFHLISMVLASTYGVKISEGGLVGILHQTRKAFAGKYEDIRKRIQAALVKHGDETGWRVKGVPSWVWGFFARSEAYYTIEESRGKGVAEKVLAGSGENDLLVRDDYGAYQKLPMRQQSCWAHLLRKSHEEASQPEASAEMQALHQQLKGIYDQMAEVIGRPFDEGDRYVAHQNFLGSVEGIIGKTYTAEDAMRVQERMRRQGDCLVTALLVEGAPLTNNLAERCLRPMVVTRKISGGSQSEAGALSHAVNMSVIQTLLLQNQPLGPALRRLLARSPTA